MIDKKQDNDYKLSNHYKRAQAKKALEDAKEKEGKDLVLKKVNKNTFILKPPE